MANHSFILKPQSWQGEGKIQLNMVQEELIFHTKWNIGLPDATGKIESVQEIQVKGLSDTMINQFSFYDVTATNFLVEMENQALGKISGTGLITKNVIAWEFRIPDIGFEGFEFYEQQEDGSYIMRAEYSTSDQFRTLINGKVWHAPVLPKEGVHE